MKKSIFLIITLLSFITLLSGCLSVDSLFDAVYDKTIGKVSDKVVDNVVDTTYDNVEKAVETIEPEQEYYIGRSVCASILSNFKIYNNKTKQQYMNKILQTLVLHSERPTLYNGYHLLLLDTDEFNAFATSGGHILITRGLADSVKSEDELAAVIAHEIGHVQNGDAIKSIKANRWTNVVTGVATSAVSALDEKAGADLSNMVDDTITTMVNNGFSKTQEYDADKAAVSILASSGYNPGAIVEMLKRIQEREPKDKSKLSGMYKTHPAAEDRIKEVTKVLAKVKAPEDTSAMREARFAKNMGK